MKDFDFKGENEWIENDNDGSFDWNIENRIGIKCIKFNELILSIRI